MQDFDGYLQNSLFLPLRANFGPNFGSRGPVRGLFWAITFEPIEIQTSKTHQNLAFFMLFHFVPKSFSVKLILFIKNDKMQYLDPFRPIFEKNVEKSSFLWKLLNLDRNIKPLPHLKLISNVGYG